RQRQDPSAGPSWDPAARLLAIRVGSLAAGGRSRSRGLVAHEVRLTRTAGPVGEPAAAHGRIEVFMSIPPGQVSVESERRDRKAASNGKVEVSPIEAPAYQSFPLEALPEPVRAYVDASAAAIGCDHSYVALPMLSTLAAAIGNTRRALLKPGWSEPAIVW